MDRQSSSRRVSRRGFLKAALAGGAGLAASSLLLACGEPPKASQPAAPAPPAKTAAPAPQQPAQPAAKPAEAAKPAAAAPAGQIVVNIGQDPVSMDPQFDQTTTAMAIYANQFDFLVRREDDMKIVPAIATTWKTINDTTWEFKIRKDVKFHDGSPLTVDDIKFTFDRVLDTKMKSLRYGNINMVDHAEVVDDSTVRLITKFPYAPLLSRLVSYEILPKKVVQALGDQKFALTPTGSGPYKFKEWVKDDHITLEANTDYWRGAPKIKTVIFKPVVENSTRISNLKTGAADIIVNLPPHMVRDVEADKNLRAEKVHSARTIFIGISCFRKPLDDKRVRQALNYAVDVDAIIKNILGGDAYRLAGPVGELAFGFDPTLKPYAYDPAKAKALLAEAGYPNGFELEFRSPQGRYVMDKEVSEAAAGYLEKVGIKPKLMVQEWGTFYSEFLDKKFAGVYLFGVGNSALDADAPLYQHYHTKGRGLYYNSPKTDELISRGQSTIDPNERLKIYAEVQRVLMDEAPWIFLFDQKDMYGASNRVNWKPRSDEMILGYSASLK